MRAAFLRAGLPALVLVGLAGCGKGESDQVMMIATAEVRRMDMEIVAEASGSLEPITSVDVMSKASGEVVEILVDTGDEIEAGTLMAQIDPRDVQNEYNQTLADFEVAEQRLAISEAQFRRSAELLAAGVITEQEHESRDLDRANSRSSFERARTSLDLSRIRLEDVTIRAPLAGTVLTKNVEEGTVISSPSGNVSGGTVLFTVADLSVMQVRSLVNESDVGRLQAGMGATVMVDAFPDQTFEGAVEKIEAQATVSQSVVNFPVIVTLDNSQGLLRPGMSANVTIRLAERANALTVPNHAIVTYEQMLVAAEVLGVPDDRLLVDQSGFQELRQQVAAGAAGALAATGAATAQIDEVDLDQLRQQLAARGGGANIEQALQQALSGRGAAIVAGRGGGGRGGGGRGGGGNRGGGTTSRTTQPDEARPGVVFVQDTAGGFNARAVLIGVTDWTNSEIMAGLEDGEVVALLGGVPQQSGNNNSIANMMRFRF